MTGFGSLYGLINTNRQGKDLWGKNQFNSTFPAALACYMRDHGMNAVYIKLNNIRKTICSEISIDDLFNTTLPNEKLFFDFESRYEPFDKLADHVIERVDLVIRETKELYGKDGSKVLSAGAAISPLEVKLTVVPDNTTCRNSPDAWYPEMVIRPATIMYCAMSMASQLDRDEVKEIFHAVGKDVKQWGNLTEAKALLPNAVQALNMLHEKFHQRQKPLILQPIWRTKGKQPLLDDNAFDIFVWSDYALTRVFIDLVMKAPNDVTRFGRSALRLTRFLHEYGRAGSVHINNIFGEMTYEHQSDKEFSLNGKVMQQYMNHPRMGTPLLGKEVIKGIILDGGEKLLSPERRLDQTVYLAYSLEGFPPI